MNARFILLSSFLLLLATATTLAQTITSTISGGLWHNATTWVGGSVPASSNDVIIAGTVNLQTNTSCRNLTVNSGATLQNDIGYDRTLSVSGNVINNGTIKTIASNWWFYLDVKGNVTNSGSFAPYRLYLSGSGTQTITATGGNSYDGAMNITDTTGQVLAGSALVIKNGFNLQGGAFNLQSYPVSFEGAGNIYGGRVLNPGDVTVKNGATLSNVTYVGNVNLKQRANVGSGVVVEGNVTVVDTLIDAPSQDVTMTIKGNITNNGVVMQFPPNYWLYLNVLGNIVNNGQWETRTTYLAGSSTQTMAQAQGKFFSGPFEVSDTAGLVVAGSPLTFRGTVNLKQSRFDMAGNTLTFEQGGNITNGRVLNLGDVVVQKGAIIGNVTYVGNPNFKQRANVTHGFVVEGNVTVTDTLVDAPNQDVSMTIKGNITNNGVVMTWASNWYLWLYVSGNITNNGQWETKNTYLSSTTTQSIAQVQGKFFSGSFEVSDTAGLVVAASPLTFKGGVNLKQSRFDMAGYALTFEGGGNIYGGRVLNPGDVNVKNGAILGNVTYVGNPNFKERANVGHGVVIEGRLTVTDTLVNAPSQDVTMVINGGITNNGVVMKWASNWYLWLNISGDITNNGSWVPQETRLTGEGERTVVGPTMQNPIKVTGSKVTFVGENVIPGFTVESNARCIVGYGATLRLTGGAVNGKVENNGRGTSTQKIVSNAAANYNFFNAYVNIVAGSKIDSLTIDCYGNQVPSSFANAVKSWWRISSKLTTPGTTTIPSIRFTYGSEILGNNTESQLQVYHSADSGHTWRLISTSTNTTRDLNAKTVTIPDIPASGDILLSSSPDPVAVRPSVILSVVGRSQIRVGPPNRYTVDYVNNSDVETGDMLISLKMSGGIQIKQIEPSMPSGKPLQIIPVDSLAYRGEKDSCILWVASMAPREERKFDVILNAYPDPGGKLDAPSSTKIVPFLAVAAWWVGGALVSAYVGDVTMTVAEEIWRPVAPCETVSEALKGVLRDSFKKTNSKWFGFERPAKAVADQAVGDLRKKIGLEIPGEKLLDATGATMRGAQRYLNGDFKVKDCSGKEKAIPGDVAENDKTLQKVTSWDPNEKVGPAGFGAEGFMSAAGRMNYQILFENKKEATAPAWKIVIIDTLQPEFDPETVEFGKTSHDGAAYNWIKTRTGSVLKWDIEGIELLPNVHPPEGEGYVTFSVIPKSSLASGTKLRNRATIVFDFNKPIATNEVVNTLDFSAPTTVMRTLPGTHGKQNLTVRWQVTDGTGGSGVKSVTLFASRNGGEFVNVGASASDSLSIEVTNGEYRFYGLAADNVGNVEIVRPSLVQTTVQGVVNVGTSEEIPLEFSLAQNYPNPFNPSTEILFTLSNHVRATLKVYDMLGREVATLLDEEKAPGRYTVTWDAGRYSSGVYFYRLIAGDFVATRKLVLLK